MSGKGDKPRPVDKERYQANYQKIFRCEWEAEYEDGTLTGHYTFCQHYIPHSKSQAMRTRCPKCHKKIEYKAEP